MLNGDRYASYAELNIREREGIDYRVCVTNRQSPVAIVAPHGGKIERWTSELAVAIAGDTFSVYCFEGLRPQPRIAHHVAPIRRTARHRLG